MVLIIKQKPYDFACLTIWQVDAYPNLTSGWHPKAIILQSFPRFADIFWATSMSLS